MITVVKTFKAKLVVVNNVIAEEREGNVTDYRKEGYCINDYSNLIKLLRFDMDDEHYKMILNHIKKRRK